MRIFDLTLKDLTQILRDKKSLLFLVAMPIVFTLFMGFAYRGNSSDENADTRIPLAVVNPEPESRLNKMLLSRLDSSDTIKTGHLSEADAIESLRKGEVAGVLVIPLGFSEQAEAGKEAQLKLIAQASSSEGQSLYQLLRVPISQLMSAVEIAQISAGDNADEFAPAIELAWSKWEVQSQRSMVRVEQAAAQETSDWTGGNP